MPRNVLQTLTIVAIVAAIFFVAHNFVRYVLRGKYTDHPLSSVLCKDCNVRRFYISYCSGQHYFYIGGFACADCCADTVCALLVLTVF